MDSQSEQFRFNETNKIISRNIEKRGKLLEIGCGEGHQTEHFSKIFDEIHAVDVSSVAVEKARKRFGDSNIIFKVGFVPKVTESFNNSYFDVVTACEVLYYMDNIPDILDEISRVGKKCLITYYDGESNNMDNYFTGKNNIQSCEVKIGALKWKFLWWDNT